MPQEQRRRFSMGEVADRRRGVHRGPLVAAGIVLGAGLGGFVDGILLHQVLQWHHMVSSVVPTMTVPGLEVNTLWDGFFHVATWVMVVLGLALLWRGCRRPDVPWSTSTFVGSLLAGWGLFNLIEGIVDHHILGLHHVNETVPQDQWIWWDLGFLVFGAALVLVGWLLVGAGQRPAASPGTEEEQRRAG